MGTGCCVGKDTFNPNSKKLLRAITRTVDSKEKIFIQIYDVELEIGREVEINSRLLKLEGLSQINVDNYLYLCGWEEDTNKDHTGSSFYKIDPLKLPVSLCHLIHSTHCHTYPSMTCFRNEFILVVGGKESIKCEIYNKKSQKWKDLPDLTEERYGGNLICDDTTNSAFLFGGYNHTSGKVCTSVLKLNLRASFKWDTIVVMTDLSDLLSRSSSAIVKIDKSSVLIIGGKSNYSEETDQVIEYELNKKTIAPNQVSLEVPALFFHLSNSCEHNHYLYVLDDNSNVHKISRFEKKSMLSSFYKMSEEA